MLTEYGEYYEIVRDSDKCLLQTKVFIAVVNMPWFA